MSLVGELGSELVLTIRMTFETVSLRNGITFLMTSFTVTSYLYTAVSTLASIVKVDTNDHFKSQVMLRTTRLDYRYLITKPLATMTSDLQISGYIALIAQ